MVVALEFEQGTQQLPKNCKPVAVDLFCGPGGLSLGFKLAGFEIGAAFDADKEACATYRRNHRGVECRCRDIRELKGNEVLEIVESKGFEGVDVLIGGPPCRGLSAANRRTGGINNPNNQLFAHFVRLVKEIQPKVYVIENVRNLHSFLNGRVRIEITDELEKWGYKPESGVLCAADFGVPQFRKRTFIVGSRSGKFNFPKPTHGPQLRKYITVGEALGDLPKLPEGGGGSQLSQFTSDPSNSYQKRLRKKIKRLRNHLSSKSKNLTVERFRALPQGGNWSDIARLLQKHGGYKHIEKTHSGIYRRLKWDQPAPTMVNPRKSMYVHPKEDRLLSIREAARIQSFPDSFAFVSPIEKMHQQVADAVPVLLAKAVARKVKLTLREPLGFSAKSERELNKVDEVINTLHEVQARSAEVVLVKR